MHRGAKEEDKIQYLPGVCLHTDHSGPYTMSLGGHRYSQLYMDLGSGYLWAIRMAKKIGHYQATPIVIADAQAASGRKLQYFQSDGDTVFSSKETEELLKKERVRHLWGAPGDSDTNPHTERARRTIFEETTTSLLR